LVELSLLFTPEKLVDMVATQTWLYGVEKRGEISSRNFAECGCNAVTVIWFDMLDNKTVGVAV
jgi:hypothetical protein